MRRVVLLLLFGWLGCDAPPPAPVPLPPRLSGTGLTVAGSTTEIDPGHLPFSPQYPLWTDGASKRRWIHLPAGKTIDASRADAWSFPPGTRLWKEFSFGGKPAETRYMERLPDGTWRYATYVWTADGRDAELAPEAGVRAGVPVEGPPGRHVIPSRGDCTACHEGRTTPVLGFTALQLSPDRDPGALHAGPGGVDLASLAERGLLRGLPPSLLETPPRLEAASPTERAALGYLHGNCGGCHNTEGPLASVGMDLLGGPGALATVLGQRSGFRVPRRPDAVHRVEAGHADRSVIPLRMRSREALVQMPPIGTALVDEQAVALIERWIDEDLARRQHAAASPHRKEKKE
jgi:hypothetical protein